MGSSPGTGNAVVSPAQAPELRRTAHNRRLHIVPAHRDRPDRPLGRVVVHGDAPVLEEQGEGLDALEEVAHRCRQVALAGNAPEPVLAPGLEGCDETPASLLPNAAALLSRLSGDLALDVVQDADPLQRLEGDRGAGGLPDVVEGAAQMSPACRLADAPMALGARLVELPEAAVGIGLQHALEAREMGLRVLALAVGREEVGHGGRIAPAPGPVVAEIDPDPPFLDPAGFALDGAASRIKDADRRIIGMQPVRPHDLGADQVGQGPQGRDRLAAPVDQGGPGNVGPHPGEDLALAVQGKVIVELRDQDMGQQGGTRHSPPDRPGRCRLLDDPLAHPAGLLRPPGLDHLELGRDELENLGQVLAEQTKRASAVGAVVAGIEHDPLARRVVAKARFTPSAGFASR